MDFRWWIFLLFSLPCGRTAENQGIMELLQELGKEPPPEPVWMLHEAGTILDDTWKPIDPNYGE